jgi:folate-binding protein YgfZ
MGIAGAETELTDDYTPLEAGLNDAVADGKGCYTGQEVIARQLTYDKVVQRLVGLSLTAPASIGDVLYAGERRVGVITSLSQSPAYGSIGLGYVRRPEFERGTRLRTAPGGDAVVTIVELPFGK